MVSVANGNYLFVFNATDLGTPIQSANGGTNTLYRSLIDFNERQYV